ncbi:MAG: J domain-containing protein [Myxococcales bacterium]|nr:J domain-containing protein [Myxococcales bacterium]MCB9521957.1 J domain-containing protein [Myxococcales bacterium]
MANADLYGILGVGKDASAQDIKKAYRALANRYHPDKNPGDKAAEERFKQISGAYAVLGDDDKRKLYDEFGPDGLREGFDPEAARNYQRWAGGGPGGFRFDFGGGSPFGGGNPFGGGLGGFGNLDELLGGLFGGGGGPRMRPQRGAHVEGEVTISLRQALDGTEVPLRDQGGTARIPPGIAEGQKIRLAGLGQHGPAGRGDLYLSVLIAPPPGFTREDADLYFDLPLTVGQAVRGAKVELPNPEGGLVTISVPPGSQTGRKMRFKGKGVPTKDGRGHLYVRLQVQAPAPPAQPDARFEALLDELEGYYQGQG